MDAHQNQKSVFGYVKNFIAGVFVFITFFMLGMAALAGMSVYLPKNVGGIISGIVFLGCAFCLYKKPKIGFLDRKTLVWPILIVSLFGINGFFIDQKDAGDQQPQRTTLIVTESSNQPIKIQDAFSEKDFYWTQDTTPWKTVIIKGVNKIQRENPHCRNLDPGSADKSLSKGTKSNPVFYVTCQPPGESSFNVFFSKSDVDSDKNLVADRHIDVTTAKQLCEKYAETQAQNPQTVKFSWVLDMGMKEYPNGRTRINSSFSASNLMGVEMKFNVTCLFDSKGFIEGVVTKQP